MLRKSISYFLSQDYENKELVILNNHEVPLSLSEELKSENITVVNKGASTSVGHFVEMQNEVLQTLEGDFVIPAWDDDDMFLPWHISSLVKLFSPEIQAARTHPNLIMFCREGKPVADVQGNYCEPSNLVRMDFVKKYGFGGPDKTQEMFWHWSWLNHLVPSNYIVDNYQNDTGYVLIWDRSCFDDTENSVIHAQCFNAENCTDSYIDNLNDTGDGKPLTSCSVKPLYQKVYDALHNMECPIRSTEVIKVAVKLKQYL
jgi:hypothetical protein